MRAKARSKPWWAVALVLFGAEGCYRATFYRDPTVVKGDEHEEWTDFFVFGSIGTETFDVHQFCPTGNVAVVRTGGNFGTGIIGLLTIGIYTPRKVYVTCAASAPGAPASRRDAERELTMDADRAGRPVRASVTANGRKRTGLLDARGAGEWHVSFASEESQ